MSPINGPQPKKEYSIVRYARIRNLPALRHVSNHNTRAVVSENIRQNGPAPEELLNNGDVDIVVAARRRAAELGLSLPDALGAGKVIAVETFLGASPEFFERATPDEVDDWYRSSTEFLKRKFGRALISVMKHEDEKTPHIQGVALAAVEKKVGVRGRPPKDPERRRLHDATMAAMPLRWTFSYNDLLGGAAARLSYEQDYYNDCVKHLGLARGEPQKEVNDLVLDNGVVVVAARVSRGKRKDGSDRPARHFTTQEYQAETRRDRARTAQQQYEVEQALERIKVQEEAAMSDRAAAADERAAAADVLAEVDGERAKVAAAIVDVHLRAAAVADAEASITFRRGDADRREQDIVESERTIAEALVRAKQEEAIALAARSEAERLLVERITAEATAQAANASAVRDAAAARRKTEEADRLLKIIGEKQAAIETQQREVQRERELEREQAALLARAADDAQKLGLQEMGSSFWINDQAMSADEQTTYHRPWSTALTTIALHIARALEAVREMARKLAAREDDLLAREADISTRKALIVTREVAIVTREHDAARQVADRDEEQRRRHEARIAELDDRARALADDKALVMREAVEAAALMETAETAKATADAALDGVQQWTRVIDLMTEFPGVADYDEDGRFTLDDDDRIMLPESFVATVADMPPTWAVNMLTAMQRNEEAMARTKEREQTAAMALTEMEDFVARAGPVMTPAQEDVAAEAKQMSARWAALANYGDGRGG